MHLDRFLFECEMENNEVGREDSRGGILTLNRPSLLESGMSKLKDENNSSQKIAIFY